MSVSFNEIPANIRKPLFYAEVDNSLANAYSQNLKTLMFAQSISTVDEVPTFIASADQAVKKFGVGSMAHIMAKAYFANNRSNELWVLPMLDDGSATKAEYSFTITEADLTEALTVYVNVGGTVVEVNLAKDDTPTLMANKVASVFSTRTDLPVVVTSSAEVLTLTAKNGGTVANAMPVTIRGIESNYALVAGTGDPAITATMMNAIGDLDFEFWLSPFTDTTRVTTLSDELNARWDPLRQKYGHLFLAVNDNTANLQTFGNSLNNQHVTVIGTVEQSDWFIETLAAYVATVALSFSIDPARPTQTLDIAGLNLVKPEHELVYSEIQSLLFSGICPLDYSSGVVRIIRTITTYKTNAFGAPDVSYLDANTLFTLAQVIRRLKGVITSKFSRVKLVNDGVLIPAGSATVSPKVIRIELISIYDALINIGLCENAEKFEETLVVERNADDPNRLDVQIQPDLVNQLRVVAVKNSFRLQF